jgi:hypothetical protein
MFSVERGVLKLHEPPESANLRFLCWPVLVYRVAAPVLRVRHLDLFEKVILALCRAGVRQAEAIAVLIHHHPSLVEHVLRQLRLAGRLDESGAPTAEGLRTSDTGRLDEEPELIVTHVFQDPFSGELWPRAATDLVYQPVQRVRGDRVDLRLRSAGEPHPVEALVVQPEAVSLSPPTAEQIIAAVGAQRAAQVRQRAEQFAAGRTASPAGYDAQQELNALNTELGLPADHDVRRVVDVRDPVREYLLVWLDVAPADDSSGTGWRARDPFGLDPSPMLQQLVAARMRTIEPLATMVSGLAEVADERLTKTYRKVSGQVRQAAETTLVQRLGTGIRLHPGMLDLLVGLEDSAARGNRAAVEAVAQDAFRAYEHLFRRLVREYPPPRPAWLRNRNVPDETVADHLRWYADELGLLSLPGTVVRSNFHQFRTNLTKLLNEKTIQELGERGFARDLIPYALVAAVDPNSPHRTRHPLGGLAARRPAVFTELLGMSERFGLSNVRNRGAHADRDPTVAEDIEWCRGLALDAGRTVLDMSPQSPERITA